MPHSSAEAFLDDFVTWCRSRPAAFKRKLANKHLRYMDAAGFVACALGDGAGDDASLNLNVLRKNIYGHIQQCAPAGLFSSIEFHIDLLPSVLIVFDGGL